MEDQVKKLHKNIALIGRKKEFSYREWLIGQALQGIFASQIRFNKTKLISEAIAHADEIIYQLAEEK